MWTTRKLSERLYTTSAMTTLIKVSIDHFNIAFVVLVICLVNRILDDSRPVTLVKF